LFNGWIARTLAKIIAGRWHMNSASAPERRWRLWLTLFCLAFPLQMTVTASPFLNALAMDGRGLNSAEIGAVRTIEILINASLLIYLSARLSRLDAARLGLFGLAAYVGGNLICLALTPALAPVVHVPGWAAGGETLIKNWDLVAGRAIAGAGAGCANAAMGALLARMASPHRAAALIAVPITLTALVAAGVTSRAAETGTALGVFGFLAAGGALAALGVAFGPGKLAPVAAPPMLGSMLDGLRQPYVLACATMYFGSTAVYHFLAKIGEGHGLGEKQIGEIVILVTIACAVSVPLAALIRDAWVRVGFLVSVFLFAVGSSSIPLSPNATVYTAGFWLQSAAFGFYQILGAAVAARLDRTGGLAAAGNGWQSLGNSLSPFLGGVLILGGAFWPLGALCIAASSVTFVLYFVATRRLTRAEAPA
jgi:predicted MFS family arabinose efflux permease